ncbi:MAG TPA: S9 family peptidase, partial [Bdellovibrionales bacterium]|nr:S9 family peptidase [Bdellovibrionales bacterium]
MSEFKPALKKPHQHEIHGDTRHDDYFWMRERDSEPVMSYLKQENARTEFALKPVAALETKLYQEMRARIKEDDSTVPAFSPPYWYYTRFEQGKEYPIYCRKKDSLSAAEQIIFNENEHATGHDYYQVAGAEHSPDHRYLALPIDKVGRRIYEIRFMDLQTGKLLDDLIEVATPSIAWAADSRTLFFVRQDLETLRAHQVYRYEIGSGVGPELVYEEKDNTFNVYVGASKNGKRLFMGMYKRDSSETHMLDASTPKGEWVKLAPREDNHEYTVSDGGDRLYILTNWQAVNFRVMEAPLTSRSKSEWKELVPHSSSRFLEEIDPYKDFLVVGERENGLTRLSVIDRKTGKERRLDFPDESYEMSLFPLPDYESEILRFAYDSMVRPPSVFDEVMKTGERMLKKVREVPGFKQEHYESRRLWAAAKDGTKVPISIAYKKGMKLDGGNPLFLYGYGSYGLSMNAHFSSSFYSLIDRGFVVARPHIRGGSEMGRHWYEQGRLQHKMNTFTDFIACAEKLIADGYTSPEHLHIMGGSAGGLLMGAVMNLRPELFKSVSAGVPFVDVLTTMLDESIPLTTGEYKEWGDPRKADEYGWMRTYSPYDNIERKAYPHMLVTTGYHDSQVQYWEPAKWVAKLREYKTDDNLLLLYTEFEAGHSGASGRFEALKLLAKEFAFILMVEG